MNLTNFNPLESLIFLTNRVGRLLSIKIKRRSRNEEVMRMDAHMGILVDLWEKDGVKQQDLAASLIKDKATIARSLSTMEKMDLLVRVPDENDKRNKRIYLTNKGRSLHSLLMPHAKTVIDKALQDIPEEEVAICKKVLIKMYENLQVKEEIDVEKQYSDPKIVKA